MDVEIKWDEKKLGNLKQMLANKSFVKVGVLSDGKIHPSDSIGAASLAAVHEFGSAARSIPERSFLRTTFNFKQEAYVKFLETNRESIFKAVMEKGLQAFLPKIGALWVGWVQDSFITSGFGSWKPLASSSRRPKGDGKGNHKPLIDTGALMGSITYEVVK